MQVHAIFTQINLQQKTCVAFFFLNSRLKSERTQNEKSVLDNRRWGLGGL